MRYSKDSQHMMNFFLKIADGFLISSPNLYRQEKILSTIYKEIHSASNIIKRFFDRNAVYSSKIIIVNPRNVPFPPLLSSSLVPPLITAYIKQNSKNYLHYYCYILNRKIDIYITLFNQLLVSQKKKFDAHVARMLTWLRIAFMYSPAICGKNIKIYLYWTTFEKQIPSNSLAVLGTNNCNSALTTTCPVDGTIVIFRKEEWFKVFIHETFHVLGLDFSGFPCNKLNEDMFELMPIKSEFNLFEAYSETWATILNCLFCAYELLDKKDNVEDFLLYSDFLIQFEKMFSLFQCVKILEFMGIQYIHLYTPSSAGRISRDYLYQEKTNVFAYYIMKALLLYNFGAFLEWCDDNNINLICFDKSDRNIRLFFLFIKKFYKEPIFLNDIKTMQDFYISKKFSTKNIDKIVNNNLRMTICELE